MKPVFQIAAASLLFLVCVALRKPLEVDPVTHVLVLLPALASAGGLMLSGLARMVGGRGAGPSIPVSETAANSLVLVAVFVIFYWMLPRAIDGSLTDTGMELAKFISIPLFVGGILALAWRAAHSFLRGFLKANAISMCAVMGFLYTHAPVRICNSYLVSDQERLGIGFLFVAMGLGIVWAIPLFLPPVDHSPACGVPKPNKAPREVNA